MKFYELTGLIENIVENEKKEKHGTPTLRFILTAYNNVLDKLRANYSDNEMVTAKKIEELELTKYMTNKLIDLSTKTISKKESDTFKQNAKINNLKYELSNIMGLGTKKINELIDQGLTKISQLHKKKYMNMLNLDTQMDILYKPRHYVPYQEIKKVESLLTSFKRPDLRGVPNEMKLPVITGSFARKKEVIGDIDILYLSRYENDIDRYLDFLSKALNGKIWVYLRGPDKVSFIFEVPKSYSSFNSDNTKDSPDPIRYKADIFIANIDNYYSMLLYSIGSKNFNIRMRAHARKLGLLLNQNGIFKNGKKINTSKDNEKKLFEILQMDYVLPKDRI